MIQNYINLTNHKFFMVLNCSEQQEQSKSKDHVVRLSSSMVTVSDQRKNIYRRLHLENLVIKVKRQRQNERNLGSFLVKTHVLLFFLHLRKHDEKVQFTIRILGFDF